VKVEPAVIIDDSAARMSSNMAASSAKGELTSDIWVAESPASDDSIRKFLSPTRLADEAQTNAPPISVVGKRLRAPDLQSVKECVETVRFAVLCGSARRSAMKQRISACF